MTVINGTINSETLKGGADNDLITGFAGADRAVMRAGNDLFVSRLGDGNDTVEGGIGTDTLRFFGSDNSDFFQIMANGTRTLAYRSADSASLDLNDVERIDLRALGGTDTIQINDLTGTDVKQVAIDLAGMTPGAADGAVDLVTRSGSAGNDTISVARANGRVSVAGLSAQMTISHADSNDRLKISGNAGNDVINATNLAASAMRLELYGGEGNDKITGGNGNDDLYGDSGNDVIAGGKGNDFASLGDGNDLYAWSVGDGNDTVDDVGGTDILRLTGSKASESFFLGDSAGSLAFFHDKGQVQADLVERVQIRALGGVDVITITDLSGTAVTQVAVDLAAKAGGALADGNVDRVRITGTGNNDIINVGWEGSKVIVNNPAVDASIAHAGANDILEIYAEMGNDIVSAGGVPAGKMRLMLSGGGGDDVIFGGAGNDTVVGGLGQDLAYLGGGNDQFIWNTGDGYDTVVGGAGVDTVVVNGAFDSESVHVTAQGDRANVYWTGLVSILEIDDAERVRIQASGGADNINVHDLSGTDVKQVAIDLGVAGAGDGKADLLGVRGTEGNDHVTLAMSGGALSVTGLPAQVTFIHGEAQDWLTISAAGGDDIINAASMPAGTLRLSIYGEAGNDSLTGGAGNDELLGYSDNDTLRGGAGKDFLDGGGDNDYLNGGTGADELYGDLGDDVIVGGRGDDVLVGGDGSDTFRYTSVLDGHDVIQDFDGDAAGGQDTLNLDALFDALGIANGSRAGRVELVDNGGTVEVHVNADGKAGNGFELHVATLTTVNDISVGQDIVVAG